MNWWNRKVISRHVKVVPATPILNAIAEMNFRLDQILGISSGRTLCISYENLIRLDLELVETHQYARRRSGTTAAPRFDSNPIEVYYNQPELLKITKTYDPVLRHIHSQPTQQKETTVMKNKQTTTFENVEVAFLSRYFL